MLELLKNYPEAGSLVKAFFLEIMLESLNTDDLPEDFKEHVRAKGIDDETIGKILDKAPRNLFDVFDENELYIQITGDNKNGWAWEVEGSNDTCSSRKEAEQKAVEESFRILNEKLCQTES